ncbi:hypothetical protein [Nannocystis punicea]|uniref:Uncharacterized protein n=1 Tax=Nannocystis punicea TaxID=2995304 RepID=A0ABY7GXD0_9BACT|nr:hypothetical protein [Nannocystis poenicansa]WAS91534.1 hypothetical protein O0S08_35575 [Nannocystis poenicansa]
MTKVTIQRDICLNLVVPLTATHNFIPLPPFPPIPPPLPGLPLSLAACALESPVNAWWPPGYALGGSQFTTSVFHQGMAICLAGHDCGKFIPHLQIAPAPNNMLTLVHIPFSSRKANFSASTVKMNGKPVAGMTAIAWPPTPMTYCANPISMPLADAPTSHLNTVTVHISLLDWLAGVFAVAAGMLLDALLFRWNGGTQGFGRGAGKTIAQSRGGATVAQLLKSEFIGQLLPGTQKAWQQWAVKQGVGVLVGAVQIGLTGEGSASVGLQIGGPFLSVTPSVSVSHTNSSGWGGKAGVSGQAGTASGELDTSGAGVANNHPLGLGQDSISHQWGKGTTKTNTDISDPFNGFHNQTTTTGPDGKTTISNSRASSPLPNSL